MGERETRIFDKTRYDGMLSGIAVKIIENLLFSRKIDLEIEVTAIRDQTGFETVRKVLEWATRCNRDRIE